MEPALAEFDLRPAFYVSRSSESSFSIAVTLSEPTKELLQVMRATPDVVDQLKDRILAVPEDEVDTVMSTLVTNMRSATGDEFKSWLRCCVAFESSHTSQSSLLRSTLTAIEPGRWDASSVVLIADRSWSDEIEQHLSQSLGESSRIVKTLSARRNK